MNEVYNQSKYNLKQDTLAFSAQLVHQQQQQQRRDHQKSENKNRRHVEFFIFSLESSKRII